MSRHIIPNAPGSPTGRETTVGWDPPLTTFFAMAFDPPASGDFEDDETEVFWVGCMPNEIPTVDELVRVLAEHNVELPAGLAARLENDKAREGDRSDNPGRGLVASLAALAQHAEETR